MKAWQSRNHTSIADPGLRFGLMIALLSLPTRVQAQSELFQPYNLHIVVHVAENRLLTEVFRKRIERELRDGFQAALGDMGRVTVTHEHPRLTEVLEHGLRFLDSWRDRDDQKTHFVLIDYTGEHYEIQARQYDGTISWPSPVVRRARTRDRDFVAKAAALLIKQDFGILGTVRTEPEGLKEQVQIELRGGGLGDLTHWVKKDDVFALAPPQGGTMAALKWSLLKVEQAPAQDARDGLCVCRFFHRYDVPSIRGFRCLKLGTVQAPLRIRWLQRMPNGRLKPLDQRLTVDIRRYGFDGEETTKLQMRSELDGILETVSRKDGVFNQVAFVRVVDGLGDSHPQVPIALVDDQPVLIEVTAPAHSNTLFAVRLASWKNRVVESVQRQAQLFKRLEILLADPKNRSEIIEVATSGLNHAKKDRIRLMEERKNLFEEAKKYKEDLKISTEDQHLQNLEKYEHALEQFLSKQKEIEATENDPQRKKWLSDIENAKLFEKEWEYGKAIAIYERVQAEGYHDDKLSEHLEKLHKLWDPRDDKHKEAREFIYHIWPTLDNTRLQEYISKAQEAFQKCKEVGDSISIQKLLQATLAHADRLAKSLAELYPDLAVADEREAQQLKKISEPIIKLVTEIQDYLKTHAGGN